MGATPLSAIALRLFVDDLQALTDEQIQLGLTRCRRELGGNGYRPTLSIKDVFDRAGIVPRDQVEDAECRAAWDALLLYGNKYIVSDPEGGYGPRHCFGVKTDIPSVDQRTADTLRRIGGWKAIKTMTADDYPHVQRRFYDEYRNWDATTAALNAGALNGNETFQALLEKTAAPGSKRIAAPPFGAPAGPAQCMSRERVQARNSRETLMEQVKLLGAQRENDCSKIPAPPEAVTR